MQNSSIGRKTGGLLSDLAQYIRILYAAITREWHSRRNNPFASFLELLEPIFLIAVVSFAAWFMNRRTQSPLGGSPVLFFTTGLFFIYFFIHVSNRMRGAVESPLRRFPLERRLDQVFIHIGFKTLDYLILGIVLFGVIYIFFTPMAVPYDPMKVFLAISAMLCLGFGWGMINTVVVRFWKPWRHLLAPFNRVFIIFTGVLYLVDFMAPNARYVLSFLPQVHAIALFRSGFFPSYPHLVLDTSYLALCALFSFAFGLAIERVTRRSEI